VTHAVYMVACPVHHRLVGLDADGHLLGRCPGCITEAAEAQRKIERGDITAQLLLTLRGA
jgi:hypothetical protein